MSRRDLWIAPLSEVGLLFVAAAIGWAVRRPLIFASLGPTAYELVETPERRSAHPYNVVVGHLVGVLAGFLALWITNAWHTPAFGSGAVDWPRIWAATLAAGLTVEVTLLIRAAQPAAISTALLVALGSMQTWQDGFCLMGGVLIMLLCGEPVRLWRLRMRERLKQAGSDSSII